MKETEDENGRADDESLPTHSQNCDDAQISSEGNSTIVCLFMTGPRPMYGFWSCSSWYEEQLIVISGKRFCVNVQVFNVPSARMKSTFNFLCLQIVF
jgi:hypothetical protein